MNGNNNIIIENYVYKAFLSNITTINDRITIQFLENCEADFESNFSTDTSSQGGKCFSQSEVLDGRGGRTESRYGQDTPSQGGKCFSLVIKDIPNLITKEIKINVDNWSYLCRGEWIQLQNLEDTIIAALHDR